MPATIHNISSQIIINFGKLIPIVSLAETQEVSAIKRVYFNCNFVEEVPFRDNDGVAVYFNLETLLVLLDLIVGPSLVFVCADMVVVRFIRVVFHEMNVIILASYGALVYFIGSDPQH